VLPNGYSLARLKTHSSRITNSPAKSSHAEPQPELLTASRVARGFRLPPMPGLAIAI
jgi:hypothetical protein